MRTLPTGPNGHCGVESVTIVQRPVVDDLGIILSGHLGASVDVQLDVRELHGDGVVMPLAIADLRREDPCFSNLKKLDGERASEQDGSPGVASSGIQPGGSS